MAADRAVAFVLDDLWGTGLDALSAATTAVRGFKRSIAAAVVAGQLATLAGVTASYVYDVAAGGSIVLVAIAVYVAANAVGAVRVRFGSRRCGKRPTADADD